MRPLTQGPDCEFSFHVESDGLGVTSARFFRLKIKLANCEQVNEM